MKNKKQQIVAVGGGDTFKTYKEYVAFLKNYKLNFEKLKMKRWKETLDERLGNSFEVISPRMPNPMNARYKEWKIMFGKLLPFLNNNLILLGHSLGGTFLVKYLSENKFPKKIKATFLVSAPYEAKNKNYSLGDFSLPKKLDKFQKQGGKIFLYHSKGDKIVPFSDMRKYKKALFEAEAIIFKDRGHFDQAEFPEIVRKIKTI